MSTTHLAKHAAFLSCIVIVFHSSKATMAERTVLQTDPYAARKVFYEEHWQSKIETALKYIEGAVVCVNVELTTEIGRLETRDVFDKHAVTEFSTTKSIEKTQKPIDEGVATNATGPGGHSQPGGSEVREEEESVKSLIPKSHIVTSFAGLVPSSVSVSVSVPKSYFESVRAKRHHRASSQSSLSEDRAEAVAQIAQVIKRDIKETVVALLPGRASGENLYARVQVTSFEDLGSDKQVTMRENERPIRKHDVVTVTFTGNKSAGLSLIDQPVGRDQSDDADFRIAAKVVDIRPNGDLVLEGKRTVKKDGVEHWQGLTGVIRPEFVGPNGRTVSADQVADLRIESRRVGK